MEKAMKQIDNLRQSSGKEPDLHPYFASCRRILAQIEQAKTAVLNEFRGMIEAQEHLLHLALNEAEALAWQSGVPHLVFPTLAKEKAQAVVTWNERQQALNRNGWQSMLAA